MTHTEIAEIYKHVSVPDGFAGQTPVTPVQQTLAPQWFTINLLSGNDIRVSLRLDTEYVFDIFCNFKSGFTWERNMFITTRFGNLDITNIVETGRKRGYRLEGKLINGVTSTPSGGRIMTVYQNTAYGDLTSNISVLAGSTILLGFREGIQKKVVESGPQLNQLGVDIDGNVSLVTGDIFGDELLTFLYQTT